MTSNFPNQIENRNYLSPVGFKFLLTKDPKISFFSKNAKIPEISLGTLNQSNYLKNLDIPDDVLKFGDFTLQFIVDENMENYLSIYNWLYGLGFPETTEQYKDLIYDENGLRDEKQQYSDGTLFILNSNYRTVAKVIFKDLYPFSLSSLDFNSTNSDIEYFTAQVSFKYTIFNIEK